VAIAWLDRRPGVTSVILGPRTLAQLADNLAGFDLHLPDDHVQRLDRVSRTASAPDGRWPRPPDPQAPPAVVRRHLERISAGLSAAIADDYAPDAVVARPFAPDGGLLEGREAIRAAFAAGAELPLELCARNIVVHESDHPDVVLAEYDYEVRNTRTGATFTVPNIQVLTIRDGLIVSSRDFHHHVALTAALT
jgi:ketosteroid isomerase-like protein